jgi:phosphotransferase family enzyme
VRTADDSAVLKVVASGEGSPRWPAAPEEWHPYYWCREPLAYRSGLLEPFDPPACRAIVERDDGSVALWLADGGDSPAWTPELLRETATRLGRAQAQTAGIDGGRLLVRGFLREYLRLHDVPADDGILGRLDTVPHTLCHNDFHPANVLADGSVIDWAYCGLGAPGLDAGVLVADGIADEAFAAELVDAAAAAVWAGYCEGLGGTFDEDDVRFAFVQGTALRLSWLPRGRKPAWDATIDFLQRLASTA